MCEVLALRALPFTSPQRGEVGSRSDPGEGLGTHPLALNPLSPPGRGSAWE